MGQYKLNRIFDRRKYHLIGKSKTKSDATALKNQYKHSYKYLRVVPTYQGDYRYLLYAKS